MGGGSAMTVGKFLCYLEEGPTQIAFMRIYYQILEKPLFRNMPKKLNWIRLTMNNV